MANQCRVCNHTDVQEIEGKLVTGTSQTTLARQYGLSQSSLSRHLKVCIPRKILSDRALVLSQDDSPEGIDHQVKILELAIQKQTREDNKKLAKEYGVSVSELEHYWKDFYPNCIRAKNSKADFMDLPYSFMPCETPEEITLGCKENQRKRQNWIDTQPNGDKLYQKTVRSIEKNLPGWAVC